MNIKNAYRSGVQFSKKCTGLAGMSGLALGLALMAVSASAQAQTCDVQRATPITKVVELYTSEGCSSCPPADRWLSTLSDQSDVLALSFHVSYWNYLGWKDPYATAETTRRQHQWQGRLRGPYVYTPQIIASGQDWRDWPSGAAVPSLSTTTLPDLTLRRSAQGMVLDISPTAGTDLKDKAGYWVYLQDGIVSRVNAGENRGETLQHDGVVRWYQPVTLKGNGDKAESITAPLPGPGTDRVAFVLTQNDGLTPVAAVEMPLCKKTG